MVIWYEILFAINSASKNLQSKSMCIDNALKQLQGVIMFFENYRDEGFNSSLNVAKNIAHEMDVDPVFPNKRRVFRKKNGLMKLIQVNKYNQVKMLLELITF